MTRAEEATKWESEGEIAGKNGKLGDRICSGL